MSAELQRERELVVWEVCEPSDREVGPASTARFILAGIKATVFLAKSAGSVHAGQSWQNKKNE